MLEPPPMLTTPAMNFTQATRTGTRPKSFQKASLSCGMPLPAASRQNELNSQPTSNDETVMTTKLPTRKVVMDLGKLDQAQAIKPVHAQLKKHRGRPGAQAVQARLNNGAGLPGQPLKELNDKKPRHSLLFSRIPVPFKANLSGCETWDSTCCFGRFGESGVARGCRALWAIIHRRHPIRHPRRLV